MSELPCANHPDRVAHSKCNDCGKLLCLECKQNLSFSSEDGQSQRILCTECFQKHRKRRNIALLAIFPVIAIIVIIWVIFR